MIVTQEHIVLQLLGDMQVGCNPGDGVYNSVLLSIESHLRGHNMTMKDIPDMPILTHTR